MGINCFGKAVTNSCHCLIAYSRIDCKCLMMLRT